MFVFLEQAKSVFYPHGKFVQDNQHGVGAIQDYTANMFNFRNTDYPEEAQEPSAKVSPISQLLTLGKY